MERSNFFGDQLVTDADLNNIETTTASQLIKRSQGPLGVSGGIGHDTVDWAAAAVAPGGIYGSPADYLDDTKNFYVLYVANYILKIAAGQATDTNGNFIKAANYIQPIKGFAATNWVWTATPSATNYVKLRYLETSGSVGANDAGDQFYTRYYDGFFVQIDGIAPTASEILLCTFLAGGSGEITLPATLLDRRTYVRTVTTADAVMLDPITKKVASHISVYDHVQAVGTGTPSATNPHGTSAADIGFVMPISPITEHRQSEHVSGILLNQRTTAAFQSFSASVGPSLDYLAFTSPIGASLSVGGNIITLAPPYLTATTVGGVGGIYYACATSAGTAAFVTTSVFGGAGLDMAQNLALMNTLENNPHGVFDNLLPIALVLISTPSNNITPLADVRRFYGMSPYDIRPDFSEPTSTDVLVDSSTHINSLVDNLARMRAQIGVALSGTPSAWAPGSPNPLTAGPFSYADAYHSHAAIPNAVTASVAEDYFTHVLSVTPWSPATQSIHWLREGISQVVTGSFDGWDGFVPISCGSEYNEGYHIGTTGGIKTLSNQFSHVMTNDGSSDAFSLSISPTRALNTTYYNDRARTRFVTAALAFTVGAGLASHLGGVSATASIMKMWATPTTLSVGYAGLGFFDSASDAYIQSQETLSFFVPPDWYYRIDTQAMLGSASLIAWSEND